MSDSIQSNIASSIGRSEQREREGAKGVRLRNKKGKHKGGAKSRSIGASRKSAGKTAAGRKGFGCRVNVHKSGSNARGALNYIALQQKNHIMVSSSMGEDRKQIEKTFSILKSLRPDIKNNVGHFSISLPPDSNFYEKRWGEVVRLAMIKMDIDPSNHPHVAVSHHDREHPHVHVVYSRIGFDKKVTDNNQLGHYASAVAENIEQRFELNLHPRDELNEGKKPPSIAMYKIWQKSGETPMFVKLQSRLDEAIEASSSMNEYIESGAKMGVEVRLNVQNKDGKNKVAGITYAMNGFVASASSLGDKYMAYGLSKKWSKYDSSDNETANSERDNETAETETANKPTSDTEGSGADLRVPIGDDARVANKSSLHTTPETSSGRANAEFEIPDYQRIGSVGNSADSSAGSVDSDIAKMKSAAEAKAKKQLQDHARLMLNRRLSSFEGAEINQEWHRKSQQSSVKFQHLIALNLTQNNGKATPAEMKEWMQELVSVILQEGLAPHKMAEVLAQYNPLHRDIRQVEFETRSSNVELSGNAKSELKLLKAEDVLIVENAVSASTEKMANAPQVAMQVYIN
jgi:Relaxase/Mobilisation nuclease domain